MRGSAAITVIAPKVNNAIQPLLVRNGYDTSETAAETILAAQKLRALYSYDGRIYVIIDDTGIGGGVTDEIKRIKREDQSLQWLIVIPLNFNMSISRVSEYYQDFNSYLWGNLRELLEDGLIAIPNDSELIGELTSRKKEIAPNGKIKIESKDKMKKRGLISPDRGDAVALAALNPLLFASNKEEGGRRSGNRRGGSRR